MRLLLLLVVAKKTDPLLQNIVSFDVHKTGKSPDAHQTFPTFLDGYCSTVQGLLDWFEVDLGFTELVFIQIDLCVLCVFVLYSRVSLSSCPFFGNPALPPPRGGSA